MAARGTGLVISRRWQVYGSALRFALILGAVFGAAAGAAAFKPMWQGAALGGLSAMVYAFTLMAVLGGAEIFLPRTRLGRLLERAPFLVTVAIKAVVYMMFVSAIVMVKLGPSVALQAFDAESARLLEAQILPSFPRSLLITVVGMVVFFMVLLRQAARLIGDRGMRDVLLGRYHRPRTEERFFLFVDIVGSTPVAERLGPLAVHRYLDRIFQIASDPVDDHRGEVYQYVGDEIVVTWTMKEGRPEARPLACLFAIEAALEKSAPEFEREFGAAPKIRAAIHAGEVVTGEIGGSRRAIVVHGDVMNTTSRIENLTRTLGHTRLVSEDALARLEGAGHYAMEDLGPQQLRGRASAIRVYAVAPA